MAVKRPLEDVTIERAPRMCHGVGSHLQAVTLQRLFQAQIDLTRSARLKRVEETVNCQDCDGDIDAAEDHNCVSCGRIVCQHCSMRRMYRNDQLECLNCIN
uniref:ARAD1B10186p n=1 Tax=Blastobotrys adeninivorans TaxID=409370 RepID=A0A060T5U0_BLAAD